MNYWNKKIEAGDTTYAARLGRGRSLAPAYLYDKNYVPIIAERLTQGNTTINTLVWNDLQKIKFDCSKKLSSFNKPVLIIQGKNDVLDKNVAVKAHAVLKNSTLMFLDHSGHYGWLDNKKDYLVAIEKFLSDNNK